MFYDAPTGEGRLGGTATCTLPETDQDLCTAILNDFVQANRCTKTDCESSRVTGTGPSNRRLGEANRCAVRQEGEPGAGEAIGHQFPSQLPRPQLPRTIILGSRIRE
jgi:hypothetical protein